jgi:hypothetical protein
MHASPSHESGETTPAAPTTQAPKRTSLLRRLVIGRPRSLSERGCSTA